MKKIGITGYGWEMWTPEGMVPVSPYPESYQPGHTDRKTCCSCVYAEPIGRKSAVCMYIWMTGKRRPCPGTRCKEAGVWRKRFDFQRRTDAHATKLKNALVASMRAEQPLPALDEDYDPAKDPRILKLIQEMDEE